MLGIEIGTSEAEPTWTEFLRKLSRYGLRGVKLVVSDDREGQKVGRNKILLVTPGRLPHILHAGRAATRRQERPARRLYLIVLPSHRKRLKQPAPSGGAVADQIWPRVPKLATVLDGPEPDVLASILGSR